MYITLKNVLFYKVRYNKDWNTEEGASRKIIVKVILQSPL